MLIFCKIRDWSLVDIKGFSIETLSSNKKNYKNELVTSTYWKGRELFWPFYFFMKSYTIWDFFSKAVDYVKNKKVGLLRVNSIEVKKSSKRLCPLENWSCLHNFFSVLHINPLTNSLEHVGDVNIQVEKFFLKHSLNQYHRIFRKET